MLRLAPLCPAFKHLVQNWQIILLKIVILYIYLHFKSLFKRSLGITFKCENEYYCYSKVVLIWWYWSLVPKLHLSTRLISHSIYIFTPSPYSGVVRENLALNITIFANLSRFLDFQIRFIHTHQFRRILTLLRPWMRHVGSGQGYTSIPTTGPVHLC